MIESNFWGTLTISSRTSVSKQMRQLSTPGNGITAALAPPMQLLFHFRVSIVWRSTCNLALIFCCPSLSRSLADTFTEVVVVENAEICRRNFNAIVSGVVPRRYRYKDVCSWQPCRYFRLSVDAFWALLICRLNFNVICSVIHGSFRHIHCKYPGFVGYFRGC